MSQYGLQATGSATRRFAIEELRLDEPERRREKSVVMVNI